ncbi:hypothetical protein EZS27_032217 [termite gut metagenome]|uniref:Uncharacterized protein n=1 Tax=termite gut metagenome TaxID=433724 RepID=A0A5J4Q7D4_9ZZZZ
MNRNTIIRLIIVCRFALLSLVSYANTSQDNPAWYKETDNMYLLSTATQLREFATLVNGGVTFEGKTVRLENEIVLNDTTGWKTWEGIVTGIRQWTPAGTKNTPFKGIFDGQGHTVSGLYISTGANGFYQGLFGFVDNAKKEKVIDFEFIVDDQHTYYSLNEFKSIHAREVFTAYKQLERDYQQQTEKLNQQREQYAHTHKEGQTKLAPGILDLEKRVHEMSEELDRLAVNVRYEEKNITKK